MTFKKQRYSDFLYVSADAREPGDPFSMAASDDSQRQLPYEDGLRMMLAGVSSMTAAASKYNGQLNGFLSRHHGGKLLGCIKGNIAPATKVVK